MTIIIASNTAQAQAQQPSHPAPAAAMAQAASTHLGNICHQNCQPSHFKPQTAAGQNHDAHGMGQFSMILDTQPLRTHGATPPDLKRGWGAQWTRTTMPGEESVAPRGCDCRVRYPTHTPAWPGPCYSAFLPQNDGRNVFSQTDL